MCRDDAESTPTGGADLVPALDAVPQHAEMAVERSVASNVQDARSGVCSMPWYCETGHDVAEVGHL